MKNSENMEEMKICKICLNKKSIDKFEQRNAFDESGYSEHCNVCSRLGLYRCLHCKDLITSDGLCEECRSEYMKKKKKCCFCEQKKNEDEFDTWYYTDTCGSNSGIRYHEWCKDCKNTRKCLTCKKVRTLDRFYVATAPPCENIEKCKNCYASEHRNKKITKKLF